MTTQDNSLNKYQKSSLVTSGQPSNNFSRPNLNPNNGGRLQTTNVNSIFSSSMPNVNWNGYSSADPTLNWNSTSTNIKGQGLAETFLNIAKWGAIGLGGAALITKGVSWISGLVQKNKDSKAAKRDANYQAAKGNITSPAEAKNNSTVKDTSKMDAKQLEIYKGELETALAENKEHLLNRDVEIQESENNVAELKANAASAKTEWDKAKQKSGKATSEFNKANNDYENAKKATAKAQKNFSKITTDISRLEMQEKEQAALGKDTTAIKQQIAQLKKDKTAAEEAVKNAATAESEAFERVGSTGDAKEAAEREEKEAESDYSAHQNNYEKAKNSHNALKKTDYTKIVSEQEAELVAVNAKIKAKQKQDS